MSHLPSDMIAKQRRAPPRQPPPVESFMGKHKGQMGAILANGASLNDHDLSKLRCVTLGVNHSWDKHWSDYHVICDYRQYTLFERSHARLLSVGGLYERIAKPGINYFDDHIRAGTLFVTGRLPIPGAVQLQMHTKNRIGGRTPDPFSMDISTGVRIGIRNIGSSAYVALQIAVSMGLDPIYMLGLDLQGPHHHGEWDPNAEALRQQDELFHLATETIKRRAGGKPTVYLCGSPLSLCTAFPKCDYGALLKAQEEAA